MQAGGTKKLTLTFAGFEKLLGLLGKLSFDKDKWSRVKLDELHHVLKEWRGDKRRMLMKRRERKGKKKRREGDKEEKGRGQRRGLQLE